MIDYVASLLPRIQQFSKGLNDTAIFADVPWGFVNDDGDKVTYIFRRNNELLVSKKGDVTTGRWEYLPVLQSLLIEHGNRKRMYNQGFVDNVVMALRKDGTEEIFLLANQQAIPDMDAVRYLEQRIQMIVDGAKKPKSFSTTRVDVELKNPHRFVLIQISDRGEVHKKGNLVFDRETSKPLEDGFYTTVSGVQLEIKNGTIVWIKQDYNSLIPSDQAILIGMIVLIIIIFLTYLFGIRYLE